MRSIPLSGKNSHLSAIVDDDRYDEMVQYHWWLQKNRRTIYAQTRIGDRLGVAMHRLILPPPPGMQIDHINRNGLDNRLANLRLATHRQNMQNRAANTPAAISYKGVTRCDTSKPKPYRAQIYIDGRNRHLGLFATAEDAAAAYDAAAQEAFGEFAYLNGAVS